MNCFAFAALALMSYANCTLQLVMLEIDETSDPRKSIRLQKQEKDVYRTLNF